MALVDCKNCGNKISEFAKICPKCNTTPNIAPEVPDNIVIPAASVATSKAQASSTSQQLSEDQKQIQPNNESSASNAQDKKNSTNRILLIVLIGGILLAVLYFSGVFDRSNNTNEVPSQNQNSNSSNSENDTQINESDEDENSDDDEADKNDGNKSNETEKNDEKSIEQLEYEEDDMWNDPTPNFVEENLSSFINVDLDYKQKLVKGVENVRVSVRNDTKYTLDFVRIKLTYSKLNNDVFATEDLYFTSIGPFSTITMSGPSKDIGAFVQYTVVEGEVSK